MIFIRFRSLFAGTSVLGRIPSVTLACLLTTLVGCDRQSSSNSTSNAATDPATATSDSSAEVTIEEAWHSSRQVADDIDSVVYWQDQERDWVLVTAKTGNRVWVLDARTGETVDSVGEAGSGPGQLQRPNGIAVAGDLLLVCERDNHRVQMFSLPELEPLGDFGSQELRRPYGIAVQTLAESEWSIFVTDNYETADEQIPPTELLGERIKHFRLTAVDGQPTASFVTSFGATSGEGVLQKVETIAIDSARGYLLAAEELETAMALHIYGLDGAFLRNVANQGVFKDEPEGLAAWFCEGSVDGYWIATDQHPTATRFRILDRSDFSLLGTFVGSDTANTDGVGIARTEGVEMFFAVDDDQRVSAFSLGAIADALDLTPPDLSLCHSRS